MGAALKRRPDRISAICRSKGIHKEGGEGLSEDNYVISFFGGCWGWGRVKKNKQKEAVQTLYSKTEGFMNVVFVAGIQ